MCSINGYLNKKEFSTTKLVEINELINIAQERGKDSFGIFSFENKSDRSVINKFIAEPKEITLSDKFKKINYSNVILNNNRAEPTTEFIESKSALDTQPFLSKDFACVHNGIIANDKELVEKYNIVRETTIDSEVLPHLFQMCNSDEEIAELLANEIKGSFALACFNKKTNKLYLATNYKPLYVMYDGEGGMFFSSLPQYLNENYKNEFESNIPVEIKPYTMQVFENFTVHSKSYTLYPKEEKRTKKALIIASSGLDSTVAASWAKESGYEISLLHFHYDAIAQEKETTQIKAIAEYLNAPLHFIPINFYKDIIGGSTLYSGGSINKDNSGESGTELALEWVPARNLVFFSIATAFAEAHNMDYIILGGNLEESGAYPDNEQIFQQKFNDLLPNAIGYNKKIEVLAPLGSLMKKEIVELGIKVKAPLHLTWSCYDDKELHCGKCGPCYMRKKAFKMAGINEVIKYLND